MFPRNLSWELKHLIRQLWSNGEISEWRKTKYTLETKHEHERMSPMSGESRMVEIFNVIPQIQAWGQTIFFRALPIPHVSYYPFDDHCRDVEQERKKRKKRKGKKRNTYVARLSRKRGMQATWSTFLVDKKTCFILRPEQDCGIRFTGVKPDPRKFADSDFCMAAEPKIARSRL